MDLKDQLIQILLEEWDCTPEDLQLSITLNPDVNRLLSSMRRSHELGLKAGQEPEPLIFSIDVRTTTSLPLSEDWFDKTDESVPIRLPSGKAIGVASNFIVQEDGIYCKIIFDRGTEKEVLQSSEFTHSGVVDYEKGSRVLTRTTSLIMGLKHKNLGL